MVKAAAAAAADDDDDAAAAADDDDDDDDDDDGINHASNIDNHHDVTIKSHNSASKPRRGPVAGTGRPGSRGLPALRGLGAGAGRGGQGLGALRRPALEEQLGRGLAFVSKLNQHGCFYSLGVLFCGCPCKSQPCLFEFIYRAPCFWKCPYSGPLICPHSPVLGFCFKDLYRSVICKLAVSHEAQIPRRSLMGVLWKLRTSEVPSRECREVSGWEGL